MLTLHLSRLVRLFFLGVVPLLLLANMVFFAPLWLAEHHAPAWLLSTWPLVRLGFNLSGLVFAHRRNNPYLGGLYLALLVFLLLFWLFIGAADVVGNSLKT